MTPSWTGTHGLTALHVAAALGLPSPTPEQQAVIEAPPVPSLVIAGAGSGKTETMAARVVWLVANGHVRREEVLGLTFTRKAAGELADRINLRLARVDEFARRGLLPHLAGLVEAGILDGAAEWSAAERARRLDALAASFRSGEHAPAGRESGHDPGDLLLRPRVSTYNAFADALVREHAARIGGDPEAALLSQSGSWLLARSVVVRADTAGLDDRDEAFSTVVEAVGALAADALDHRADLTEVAAFGRELTERLEPFHDPGRQSPDEVERAYAAASGVPVIVTLAADYQAAKHERGVIDFADQVSGALSIVAEHPDVGAALRAQYRVVLLDEYQDTSVIQTRLLAEVFRDGAVMAVGDPNQSIYGWRGASADNLAVFPDAFAQKTPSRRYDLSISWRNDRVILAAANALLAAPGHDAGRMTVPPLRERPAAREGALDWAFTETIEEEADAVADWFVARRAEDSTGAHSGAILFRAKKHMQVFADALDSRGVPHRILGLGGLLSTPEVSDVVAALRVLSDPAQGSSLLRLLAGPRFAVGVADLGALHDLASTLSRRDAALTPLDAELLARIRGSAGMDEQLSIIDALEFLRTAPAGYRLLDDFSDEGRRRLWEAAEMFARLRRGSGQPIPELLRQIETELRLDIELAANESRGPARIAGMQLRAFADEVRAFLDADERGTIASLLAWLDHAEESDELMPRPEPPEAGVVQLLTIHGAKGLEWDATAVVRMVADELPKRPRSTLGWLRLGGLPHAFRGDRAALPDVQWPQEQGTKRADVVRAIRAFKEEMKSTQESEERRLAYVAVTRARRHLLLTGSFWGGQSKPRGPGAYLHEIVDALECGELPDAPETSEAIVAQERTLRWPQDPLGRRRERVAPAAARVRSVIEADGAEEIPASPEVARLLAEREERQRRGRRDAPTRVPASRFKDYVGDFSGVVRELERPMPERPYRQTRQGTLFHAWVEQRSGRVGRGPSIDEALWEVDEERPVTAEPAADADELATLKEIFERSEWGALQPEAVELEIDFVLGSADDQEAARIVICKLDAVYRRADRGGRLEIVDWKTGRAPVTETERQERMLQLALYRLAYHRRFGVPMEDIDVALFYVAEDLVIRGDRVYSEEELVQRWKAARAAR